MTVLSRILDVLWAFPVYLLAISLSIVLIAQGVELGADYSPVRILVAAHLHHRHRLRSLCRAADPRPGVVAHASDFVLAAIGLGVPAIAYLLRDILPNVSSTLIVFVPLMMALNMLTNRRCRFCRSAFNRPMQAGAPSFRMGRRCFIRGRW